MKDNYKKFKYVPLFLSIILLGVSSAVFIFLYRGMNTNIKLTQEAEASWQREAQARSQAQSLDDGVKAVETEQMQLASHFGKSSNIVPFLDTIESVAKQAGAKADVSSLEVSEDGSYLAVDMTSSGSFESVYRFIRLVENSPYELEVVSLDMSTTPTSADADSAKKKSTPQWTANFRLKLVSFINK
jgi:hypothetical protein